MRKLVVIVLFVLAAAAVAGCNGGAGEEAGVTGGGGGELAPSRGEDGSSRSIQAEAGGAADQAASAKTFSASVPEVGPQIVQTASVRLSVARGRFEEAVDDARSIAGGLGGFVVSSSASQGSSARLVRGTLVLRIPARNYTEAMRSLAALGHLESSEESGRDVSQEYVDLRARIRQLQAVESQLLELLDRADTVGAALAVQQQLSQVQLDLEQARGRLQYLDDQVAFATISLGIHERLLPVQASGDGGFGVVDAWKKAGHSFIAVLGWTFVVLATAAPIVLILALAFLLTRAALRGRLPWLHRRPV
jgi:predicted small secreted protein